MSVYMTEEEQIEAIKKWWKRYGTLISTLFSIALLCFAAYKYWTNHQEKIAVQASNTYEGMMVAFSKKDNTMVTTYANELIKEYKDTIYADAAKLMLAKLLVTTDKVDDAQNLLAQVVSHAKLPALKQIARLRVSRILANKAKYDEALNELKQVDDDAYLPIINELKGDIFAATGRYEQAMLAYKQAITGLDGQRIGNLFLELKTSELASLTQSTTIEGQPLKKV